MTNELQKKQTITTLSKLKEYLELISNDQLKRLRKVFMIVYKLVDFNVDSTNIYNFETEYYKEIKILIEMEIIILNEEKNGTKKIITIQTQLEMEKIKKIFDKYQNDGYGTFY